MENVEGYHGARARSNKNMGRLNGDKIKNPIFQPTQK